MRRVMIFSHNSFRKIADLSEVASISLNDGIVVIRQLNGCTTETGLAPLVIMVQDDINGLTRMVGADEYGYTVKCADGRRAYYTAAGSALWCTLLA